MSEIKKPLGVLALMSFATLSTNSLANEKLWTVYTGFNYNNANFNLPLGKSDNESWSGYVGVSNRINDITTIGGAISYINTDIKYNKPSGNGEVDTKAFSLYATRNIAQGLYIGGSVGYGKSNVDINSTVNYDTDASYKTASIELSKYIPISQNLTSSIRASYSHVSSESDRFVTNLGNTVPSFDNTLNYITLGGQLTYQLNQWTPFVQLNWRKANREFIRNTNDKDYFAYSLGSSYTISPDYSIGVSLSSVFDRRYINETSASVYLSHKF